MCACVDVPINNYLTGNMELRLVEVIGQGSIGVVHKAVWHGCVVAAKVMSLPSTSTDQVMKEIEIIQ